MTDIFFSYSSKDRERVRPIRDALAAEGFDVFWDQAVPTGIDWDTWIRRHLNEAKCAMAFWSASSVVSDNVRHEATIAKQHGKLVPVLLDPLAAEQFPMGLYALQAANLAAWTGETQNEEWLKLHSEVEAKLTPAWVRRTMDRLEAELLAERARREAAERRDRTLRDQITKEAQVQQELRRERDQAMEAAVALEARVAAMDRGVQEAVNLSRRLKVVEDEREGLAQRCEAAERRDRTLREQITREAQAQQELRRERDEAKEEVATLKSRLGESANQSAEVAGLVRRVAEVESAEIPVRPPTVVTDKSNDSAADLMGSGTPLTAPVGETAKPIDTAGMSNATFFLVVIPGLIIIGLAAVALIAIAARS
jgi:hypothetical protein